MEYRIVEKEVFKIVGVREWTTTDNGQNFTNVPKMWEKLPREKYGQLWSMANTDLTGILGVCADMDDGGFDYWIAAATTNPCPPDLEEKEIPAATWAVFEAKGPIPGALQNLWQRIFSEWFPASGYIHADAPEFEWYSGGDSQSEDFISQVWIPVIKLDHRNIDKFYWCDMEGLKDEKLTDAEKYKKLVNWASRARGQNPNVFDALTQWVRDDAEWSDEKLAENEQLLMQGILARFKVQNAQLRAYLLDLKPSDMVNEAVFKALDKFDEALSGVSHDELLREAVLNMFADFSVMRERGLREKIAGNKTGSAGTNSVDLFGYINYLENCDAEVQWTLFMPDMVKNQQKGFKVDNFEYKKMPAMRFIGREGEDLADMEARKKLFSTLDTMSEYKSGFDYDVLFMHHYGLGVDVGPWHGFWGRFMKADTPVPDGFIHFDFTPDFEGNEGPPFCSQFAYAIFSGDMEAIHKHENYDSDAMYDITRNIMLGQGVTIPYPHKYWTAEVFPDGCDKYSTAYMFSAEL